MKKDIEIANKRQEKIKNTIFEMKNKLEGIKRRLNEEEYQNSKFKDKVEKNTQTEKQNEKKEDKKIQTIKKWAKNLNRHFFKEDI